MIFYGDIWSEIMKHLDLNSLINLSLTCKYMYKLYLNEIRNRNMSLYIGINSNYFLKGELIKYISYIKIMYQDVELKKLKSCKGLFLRNCRLYIDGTNDTLKSLCCISSNIYGSIQMLKKLENFAFISTNFIEIKDFPPKLNYLELANCEVDLLTLPECYKMIFISCKFKNLDKGKFITYYLYIYDNFQDIDDTLERSTYKDLVLNHCRNYVYYTNSR
ncbi:MAG: F-box protein [Candidatus Micrarchaeaceae archaeon]